MHTSVRTTILDDSISGDKIHGGTISGLQGLYTDAMVLPDDEPASGVINGAAFHIGATESIGSIFAQYVGATGDNNSVAVYDSSSIPRAYFATSAGRGYMELWDTTTKRVSLSSFGNSYFADKLMVGKTTEDNIFAKFEVGGIAEIDQVNTPFISSAWGSFTALQFLWDGPSWIQLDDWYTAYINNVVPVYTGLDARMYNGGVVTKAIDALAQITTETILAEDWDIVQHLGASGGPTLDGLTLDNDLDVGAQSRLVGGVLLGTGAEYLTRYYKKVPTDLATIQFGSLSTDPYTVEWERIGNMVAVYLPTWEENTFPGATSGVITITMTNAAFDDFWSAFTNSQFNGNGPYVATDISATEAWHHTIAVITPPATKTISIRRFDPDAAYLSSGSNWSLDTGDKIKFPTTSLVFYGDA